MYKDLGLLNFFLTSDGTSDPLEVYTGRKAVAQKYAIIFCTELDSIYMDSELGTSFLYDKVNRSSVSNSIFHVLNLANLDTVEQMRADIQDQQDSGIIYEDEEKLKTAEIKSIRVIVDQVYVEITILTEANTSESVSIPIS